VILGLAIAALCLIWVRLLHHRLGWVNLGGIAIERGNMRIDFLYVTCLVLSLVVWLIRLVVRNEAGWA